MLLLVCFLVDLDLNVISLQCIIPTVNTRGGGTGISQNHLNLYMCHISYQLKERCSGSSSIHNTIGFNPIRARVKKKIATLLPINPSLFNK